MRLAKPFGFTTITEKQIARFWRKVNIGSIAGCWEWSAALAGYKGRQPYVQFGGRTLLATRLVWFIANGADPYPLFVLHRCDNTKCCNPAHLFLGTQADNMIDKSRKSRGGGKLIAWQVLQIRKEIALGRSDQSIGAEYGVSYMTIRRIRLDIYWRYTREAE